MRCCRRMEKTSSSYRAKNKYYTESRRNILHTIKRRVANWIVHILRGNCVPKHVIEGKLEGQIEVTGRRRIRRKKLLDVFKEKRGY